jgi:hypothetical protein
MAKDRFGYGNEMSEGDRNIKIFQYTLENADIDPHMSQSELMQLYDNSHRKLWKETTNIPLDSEEYKQFYNSMGSNNKSKILRQYSNINDPEELFSNKNYKKLRALESVYDSWT